MDLKLNGDEDEVSSVSESEIISTSDSEIMSTTDSEYDTERESTSSFEVRRNWKRKRFRAKIDIQDLSSSDDFDTIDTSYDPKSTSDDQILSTVVRKKLRKEQSENSISLQSNDMATGKLILDLPLWSGTIDWVNKYGPNDVTLLYSLECLILMPIDDIDDAYVEIKNCHNKMYMQLIPRNIFENVGEKFYSNAIILTFVPEKCAATDVLIECMKVSFGAYILFPESSASIKSLVVFYCTKTKAFYGFLTPNPLKLSDRFNEVLEERKQICKYENNVGGDYSLVEPSLQTANLQCEKKVENQCTDEDKCSSSHSANESYSTSLSLLFRTLIVDNSCESFLKKNNLPFKQRALFKNSRMPNDP